MNQNATWYMVMIPIAVCACGFGLLIVPWYWPTMSALGWLLPIGPTLTVLLIGFDRIRHRFYPRAYYKELFGRVPLLGTTIVVAWMVVVGYRELWLPVVIPLTIVISMGVMCVVGVIYALLREPRPSPRPGFLPCPGCGYRIDNIPGPCCPECGRRFIAEPDTWNPSDMKRVSKVRHPNDTHGKPSSKPHQHDS